MDDIIKIVESLEKSGVLVKQKKKHEIKKKQEGGFLPGMMTPMPASLIAPTATSLI